MNQMIELSFGLSVGWLPCSSSMYVRKIANFKAKRRIMEMFLILISLFHTKLLSKWTLPIFAGTLGYLTCDYPLWFFSSGESTYNFLSNTVSHSLVLLSVWVVFFMILASTFDQLKSDNYVKLFLIMLLTLFICFKTNSLMVFYYTFEIALLPIFLMIMGWGYQPERLLASVNLFLYTVFASLPLLLCLLFFSGPAYLTSFTEVMKNSLTASGGPAASAILTLMMVAGFMVKYPLFSVHLWLPKAHVEAPVAGSMILAAILLKLGGYGLLRVSPLIPLLSFISSSFMGFSLVGGALISVLCLRQTDVKTLIAYSSVAHMSMVICATLTQSFSGMLGAYLLMVAHGVTSSGMFSAANVLYARWKTRNTLLSKSVLNYAPVFTLWWLLLCVCNMGAPPSLNLISEIISIFAILNLSPYFMFPTSLVAGLAVAYTLLLYASSQQGQPSQSKSSSLVISVREIVLMASHVSVTLGLSLTFSLIV